ncbi:hypothetical protein LY78DRAFT_657600 [Colletotrichum sublineola]|nr:hypothetical protein LY78DRAFT_657600 [Colletotrichum sublineola]
MTSRGYYTPGWPARPSRDANIDCFSVSVYSDVLALQMQSRTRLFYGYGLTDYVLFYGVLYLFGEILS